jgi:hypothetical protein
MKIAEKNRAKLEIALKELSETHEKLKEYTIKAEELTVSKERERIIHQSPLLIIHTIINLYNLYNIKWKRKTSRV